MALLYIQNKKPSQSGPPYYSNCVPYPLILHPIQTELPAVPRVRVPAQPVCPLRSECPGNPPTSFTAQLQFSFLCEAISYLHIMVILFSPVFIHVAFSHLLVYTLFTADHELQTLTDPLLCSCLS